MKISSAHSWVRALVSGLQTCVLVAAVGCSSTKLAETPTALAPAQKATPTAVNTNSEKSLVPSAVKATALHPLDDPKSPLTNRIVLFEYDSAQVAASCTQMLMDHGNYLRGHGTAKVRLEGNADERGGTEYNLALGQKRADAVAKALKLVGVPDAQIEAISFGKEKPVALGHDETSWAKNRKVDIVYQTR